MRLFTANLLDRGELNLSACVQTLLGCASCNAFEFKHSFECTNVYPLSYIFHGEVKSSLYHATCEHVKGTSSFNFAATLSQLNGSPIRAAVAGCAEDKAQNYQLAPDS